jgi:hypothetical protein
VLLCISKLLRAGSNQHPSMELHAQRCQACALAAAFRAMLGLELGLLLRAARQQALLHGMYLAVLQLTVSCWGRGWRHRSAAVELC